MGRRIEIVALAPPPRRRNFRVLMAAARHVHDNVDQRGEVQPDTAHEHNGARDAAWHSEPRSENGRPGHVGGHADQGQGSRETEDPITRADQLPETRAWRARIARD